MKKLPIDLKMKQVNTRVSVAAWNRAQELKEKLGCRLQDVLSAALLYMDEDKLKRILEDQKAAVDALPKGVRGAMRLSDEDRELLRTLLDE